MKKTAAGFLLCVFALMAAGCSGSKKEELEVLEKVDFTVVAQERLPQELKTEIENKKNLPFRMTFLDNGFLYICIGYGEQKSGGYSIQVNACDRLKNAVYVDTNLIGPKPQNNISLHQEKETDEEGDGKSYPYIVLKIRDIGLPVVFA